MTAKRCIDCVVSLVALVILLPLLLLVALAVLAQTGRPVLYRGERVGRAGRPFQVLKFRTMTVEVGGPSITGRADPRITPIGRRLRATKLDELPQLLNVLRGEMSLVGPRPEDPRFVAMYTPAERKVLSVRPGITSPAAIRYRNEESLLPVDTRLREAVYIADFMRPKLALDLEYVCHQSLSSDLSILWNTVVALLISRHKRRPHNRVVPR